MAKNKIRKFRTGATRDLENGKLDPEGFISPIVIKGFCEYMNGHRIQSDGGLRDSDNWQKLFGEKHFEVCAKSLSRHYLDFWLFHRKFDGRDTVKDSLYGIMFNSMAYLYKLLLEEQDEDNFLHLRDSRHEVKINNQLGKRRRS